MHGRFWYVTPTRTVKSAAGSIEPAGISPGAEGRSRVRALGARAAPAVARQPPA